MTEAWDLAIVYNTLIPYTWYAGVVAKLKKEASVTESGLVPILEGDATKYLDSTGAFSVPTIGTYTGTITTLKELHAGQAVIPDDNPDAFGTAAAMSNGIAYIYIDLAYDEARSAQWNFQIPRTWDGSTIRATINGINASAEVGDVVYELFGLRCGDGEQYDMTLLTLGTVTDTFDGTTKVRESPAIDLTITGAGNHAVLELQRKYGDAGDTLDESVRVLGINLEFTCTLNP